MSSTAIISLISFTLSPSLCRLSLFRARIPYEKKNFSFNIESADDLSFLRRRLTWWFCWVNCDSEKLEWERIYQFSKSLFLCHHRWETCLAFPRWTISTHPTEIAKLKRTQDFQLWFNLNTRARTLEWIHGMSIWRMKTTQNTKRN